MSSGELVEHDAQRPDVAAGGRALSAQLLRSHVRQRSRQRAAFGGCLVRLRGPVSDLRPDMCRQPEVENFDAPLRGDQDVGRFHVAMDDASGMRMGQGLGDLEAMASH